MLLIAASFGSEAIIFNLVFETNIPSITLWQSLGFNIIGRIPCTAKLGDGQMVEALMRQKVKSLAYLDFPARELFNKAVRFAAALLSSLYRVLHERLIYLCMYQKPAIRHKC